MPLTGGNAVDAALVTAIAPLVRSVFPGAFNHSAHILRFGIIDTAAVGKNKSAALAADLD